MVRTRYVFLLFVILLSVNLRAQCPYPTFRFQSPTLQSGTANAVGAVYKYTNVITGVDAYITILGTKNASVRTFDDDATAYPRAWQPLIRNTATPSIPSWVKFKIQFKRNGTTTLDTLPCVAVGVIDCDGNNSYQERISALDQSSYKTISTTGVSFTTDSFFNVNGDNVDYSGIDTNAVDAMAQVNFADANIIVVKVGAIGTCTNTDRQNCLYFKPFSALTISLPVSYSFFEAEPAGSSVNLGWGTLSETNSDHFEVQRSGDGRNFTTIATITAAGNSSELRQYSYSDQVSAGSYFYRLKQVDYNYAYSYSPVKAAHVGLTKISNVSITPNPVSADCNISFYAPSKYEMSATITDAFGKIVQTNSFETVRGDNSHNLDLSQLKAGIYFLELKTHDFQQIFRMIKQ